MKKGVLILSGIIIGFAASAQEKLVTAQFDGWKKQKISLVSYVNKPVSLITPTEQGPKVIVYRNNYYQALGAACKAEFKMEKATKIPLRIRLGSLAQTDYLEQKPNAVKPEKQ